MAGNDFILKQNLRMSPNAEIKNIRIEILDNIPPESEWKKGRVWYNNSIGKYQGICPIVNEKTGEIIYPEKLQVKLLGGLETIGTPTDGEYFPDGLINLEPSTTIPDAFDDINEVLRDLAPVEADPLIGRLYSKHNLDFRTGKISFLDGTQPVDIRLIGLTVGEEIDYITTIDHTTLSTTDGINGKKQFRKADKGKIEALLNGVSLDAGIVLENVFVESSKEYDDAKQGFNEEQIQEVTNHNWKKETLNVNPNKNLFESPSGILKVTHIENYNKFKKWQRGEAEVEIGTSAKLKDGYNEISLLHSNIVFGPFQSKPFKIFLEPITVAPSIIITEVTISSSKTIFMSGIKYFSGDIVVTMSFKVTDAFNYTYVDDTISLNSNVSETKVISWNDPHSSLHEKSTPAWNDSVIVTKYPLAIDKSKTADFESHIEILLNAKKPSSGIGIESSKTIQIYLLNDSKVKQSSNTAEFFTSENFRLPANTAFDDLMSLKSKMGTFDSTKPLSINDAMIYMGALIVANNKYVATDNNVDYSTNQLPQYFYRTLKALNQNSNGILEFESNNKLGIDFDIFIKIPAQTGWLNLSKYYDIQEFKISHNNDDIGCATNISYENNVYTVKWTIGTLSTFLSENLAVLKIVIKTNTTKINYIKEISEGWMK